MAPEGLPNGVSISTSAVTSTPSILYTPRRLGLGLGLGWLDGEWLDMGTWSSEGIPALRAPFGALSGQRNPLGSNLSTETGEAREGPQDPALLPGGGPLF